MVSLIKSEILIMMGMGSPVSSDKWKAPLVYTSERSVFKFSVGHQMNATIFTHSL